VKYSPDKSRIHNLCKKMEIYTRITVQDQGPGIPSAEYNKIFQRFYRGKQADTADGLGLGLYLILLTIRFDDSNACFFQICMLPAASGCQAN